MSDQEKGKSEYRLDKKQYDLLLSCSAKKDITAWNNYRKEHPKDEIWLQGAILEGAYLQGAYLQGADLRKANLQNAHLSCINLQSAILRCANLRGTFLREACLKNAYLEVANLQSANLEEANLQGAELDSANLQSADLMGANLQKANLGGAKLKGAYLQFANLQYTSLRDANLEGVNLNKINLQGAYLQFANLQGANFEGASLQGADFSWAKLQGANFVTALVDGETLIWECKVNRYSKSEYFTDFEGVGLDSLRIDPETKQLLEYNVRRKHWEQWYEGKPENKLATIGRYLATSPVRIFWSISDYGFSTWRIINSFFLIALIFATIYFAWGWLDYYYLNINGINGEPGIANNLFVPQQHISDCYYFSMIYFRSICLSVATMFSFGDMSNVNTQFGWKWWFSHFIPLVQMVFGYMLLAALVTRFALLFTAGSPAGKFVKRTSKEEAGNLQKHVSA